MLKDNFQFDYSDENREATVLALFTDAQNEREQYELWWRTFDNYYDGYHKKIENLNDIMNEDELLRKYTNYVCLTDAFVQVESSIDPNVPECEFYGRDKNYDSDKAKQRKYVVDYVCSINDLKSQNTANERTLRKYGDAFWKVYWDNNETNGNTIGDIKIARVNIDDIFPDPTAKELQKGEFVDYCYYIHREQAKRFFKEELKKKRLNVDEIPSDIKDTTETVSDTNIEHRDIEIQVLEHWYKDSEGDICCSILLGNKEIKHIKKYWQNTDCKLFPFVHYWRIRNERTFWNLSEIKAIIPLVNAADRILNNALDCMELMANDVWLVEEGALDENAEITNRPGETITYKKGFNPPARGKGLNALKDYIADINFIQAQIERTLRNYDTNQGKEPTRTTTASGLAQLRADAETQGKIKDYDRMQGFKRLFILIDWTGLEFYNDDRMIFIGVPEYENNAQGMNLDRKKGDVFFNYNSNNMRMQGNQITDENGIPVINKDGSVKYEYYYPKVDCDVHASSGIEKSKSFTVQVLQGLISTPITPENYKMVIRLLEELNIPQTDDITDELTERFEMPEFLQVLNQVITQMPKEQKGALNANPKLVFDIAGNLLNQLQNTQANSEKIQK